MDTTPDMLRRDDDSLGQALDDDRANQVRTYQTVAYLDGDDYSELEGILYPDRQPGAVGWPDGTDPGMDYLLQWEYGEARQVYIPNRPDANADYKPWGVDEETFERDGYIMAWHVGIAHVSLQRVIEHADHPHQPGYLSDCPGCESACHCGTAAKRGEDALCVFCT